MKIAIIGGTGLLGSNLVNLLSYSDIKAFSRELSNNIEDKYNNIIEFKNITEELNKNFKSWKPDIIINTIAIVNIQECENNYNKANYINCDVAIELAKLSKKYNSYFIHISTDHYYNDNKQLHDEECDISLLNNYAKTKYKAELELVKHTQKYLIVRTNIIGFRRRTAMSFFEWLLDSFEKEEKINLYTNFHTSPISVNELGKILLKCYNNNLVGTYNIGSSEVINKYDFGIKTAKKFNYKIDNITSSKLIDFDILTPRALTLGLDVSKIEKALDIKMPTINETINILYNEYEENNE